MTEISREGDFVRVASCVTPTEAHILKGVLEAAGLTPVVADAHLAQAHSWMTQALGGVRVLVPASQATVASEALAAFSAGDLALETEDEARPTPQEPESISPIYSPDRAIFLSFALTPLFGAVVQLINAYRLSPLPRRTRDWVWLCILGVMTVFAVYAVHRLSPGPMVIFRASFILSTATILWYFLSGQDQSKFVMGRFGTGFPKRGLLRPAILVAVAEFALGWAISESA